MEMKVLQSNVHRKAITRVTKVLIKQLLVSHEVSLTLGVLWSLAGFVQPCFLALYTSGIPGQQPLLLQRIPVGGVRHTQSTSNPQKNGLSLTGKTASFCLHYNIVFCFITEADKGELHILKPQRVSLEIFLGRPAVDDDLSCAFEKADSGDRRFSAAGPQQLLGGDAARHGRLHEGLENLAIVQGCSRGGYLRQCRNPVAD